MYNYINYFLKRGDEVTVITSKIDKSVRLSSDVDVKKIDLSIWPRIIRPILFDRAVVRILQNGSFDFDLGLERVSSSYLIAPNTHAGYIEKQNKKWRSLSDLIQLYMDKRSFANAHRIFACSDMVKDEIKRLYAIEDRKIVTLHPPVDTNRFKPDPEPKSDLRERLNLPIDKKLFLFVSTSHKRKGLDILKNVFSKLPEDHILLVAGSKIKDGINIQGLSYVKNIEDFYKAVDYTLHPAIYEPFGQIISESIACGTPVIISDRVGAKEIVHKGNGVVVDSLRSADWEEAILSAPIHRFKSEEFRKELSLDAHMEKMMSYHHIANVSVLNSDVK
ncbi:MAG: glycosyltransferase family 4 protein [Bacteroidia bacterium]|nr:glycosyltransferase family 4 protein [Bacteroidia bacterium]